LQARGTPATARIDVRPFLDRERFAFLAHESQRALQSRFDELSATDEELFALAAGTPQRTAMIDDLFDGLTR